MKPKNGILKLDTKEINLPNEVITEVFYEMLDQMEIDLKKANRKMIFETHEISIENAKKQLIEIIKITDEKVERPKMIL